MRSACCQPRDYAFLGTWQTGPILVASVRSSPLLALPSKVEIVIKFSIRLPDRSLKGALLGCVFRGFGFLPWHLISDFRAFQLTIVQNISTQVDRD